MAWTEAASYTLTALVAVGTSVGVAQVIVRWMNRNQVKADTAETYVRAGRETVEMLSERLREAFARIGELEAIAARVPGLEARVRYLEAENDELKLQLRGHDRRSPESRPEPGGRRRTDPSRNPGAFDAWVEHPDDDPIGG